MSHTRRARNHPPVSSTAEHAATEAAFLSHATAVLPQVSVPDSPAALWVSVPRARVTVSRRDGLPERLRGWVAEPVVVRILP